MKEEKTISAGGIGFCGLLTIAFIVLKLAHVIDWAWVWILCPIWISVAIGFIFIVTICWCAVIKRK